MVSADTTPLLFKDKPIFGLDIGFSSVKIMQIEYGKARSLVSGYGVAKFDPSAIQNGVIVDHEAVAKAIHDLFTKGLIGTISTNRVAISLPASRTFNRIMQLPKLGKKELDEAVRSEAEQYVPVALNDLYFDYEQTRETSDGLEILLMAVPKEVVDSYMLLGRMLNLNIVAAETNINSISRLFAKTNSAQVPAILIDFGSVSSDVTIFDKTIVVSGTVPGGGDDFTKLIGEKLGLNHQEAHVIKTKYGLAVSKKQAEITEAINPQLQSLLKELRRMIRYYEERTHAETKIGQVITMGGGANMPGLNEWLTDHLRLPVRLSEPWSNVSFGDIQPPGNLERTLYVTASGLALMNPKEIF